MTASIVVPDGGADGVVYALGDWNGGFALYAIDGRLAFTLNVGSEPFTARATTPLNPGPHRVAVEFQPNDDGTVAITVAADGEQVASAIGHHGIAYSFQHGGTALRLGHDQGFPVSEDYRPPFPWTGEILELTIESATSGEPDRAAMFRDALRAD